MPEFDWEPATPESRRANAAIITHEMGRNLGGRDQAENTRISDDLARDLETRGIRGFKRGGRVRRTGIYKLHRGEHVVPARKRRARRK